MQPRRYSSAELFVAAAERIARSGPMSVLRIATIASLATSFAAPALAGAFYIPGGTDNIGRAFAGDAASAEGPGVVYSNPAAMTELKRAQGAIGATLINPSIHFTNTGSTAATPGTLGAAVPTTGDDGGHPGHATPVPSFFYAAPVLDGQLWLPLRGSPPLCPPPT